MFYLLFFSSFYVLLNVLFNVFPAFDDQLKLEEAMGRMTRESEDDEDEKDEMPADLCDLAPEEQQKRIQSRAAIMLGLGTLLVIFFSDPMVSVLAEVGARTGISPFYVSFVFAPLASNASEVISTYKYALKKTSQSINISMSALEGKNK